MFLKKNYNLCVSICATIALLLAMAPPVAGHSGYEAGNGAGIEARTAGAADALGAAGTAERAEYLLDEDFSFLASSYSPSDRVLSGWDVRAAGGALSYQYYNWFKISDTNTVLAVTLNKKFNTQTGGKITLEYRFQALSAIDGIRIQLRDGDTVGTSVLTNGSNLCLDTAGTDPVLLQPYTANQEYGVKVIADISAGTADVYVNGALRASGATFKNNVAALDNVYISTGEASTGEVYLSPVKIYKGYAVNEKFTATMANLPGDWVSSASGGAIAVEKMDNASAPDYYGLKMDASGATGAMSLTTALQAQSGNLVFNWKMHLPQKTDGVSAELLGGGAAGFKFITADGKFSYVDASEQIVPVYEYIGNLWYDVKLKLDTSTNKADIYINSKLVKEGADFASGVSTVDGIRFSTDAVHKGILQLDDIQLYKELPLPDDYVPAPVKADTGDILVGAQSCSMWREGHHLGWDRINPYPERKPLLGFYDEGNPEAADWEIKWMAEHGIGYEMFCWFRPGITAGKPIKDPDLSAALHGGYFNAEYSGLLDFAIIWENSGGAGALNSQDFRTNIVPYWVEYYLKDPRYLAINNKPVISIYSLSSLKSNFGSVAAVKAEMDYLRNEAKSLGFDDLILLACYSGSDANTMREYKDAGFDAIYAYSWGSISATAAIHKQKLESQRDAGGIDMIPILGMGRDDSAWGGASGYYFTPEECEEVAQWAKDDFMPTLPETSPGRKMVLLDNWNEYGEGHFFLPSQLNGFGYVDAIRNVFANEGAHEDLAPTQAQKDRICVLYPQDRVLPEKKRPVTPTITEDYSIKWNFDTDGDLEGWGSQTMDLSDISVSGGFLSATSTGADPWIHSPDGLGFFAEDNPYIHIRMKNSTSSSEGRIYFITENDTTWNESKRVMFTVNANDPEYSDYYVKMWDNANWTGKIKTLRFDPSTAAGDLAIDFIGVTYFPMKGFNFYLDGQITKLLSPVKLMEGVPMLPVEEAFTKMGIPKQWDESPQKLVAVKNSIIGRLIPGETTAWKDKTAILLDHAPVFSEEVFYAPASFLRQAFGYSVTWDEEEDLLIINKPAGAIPVLGENLIRDPGMETGEGASQISGWMTQREYTTQQKHEGDRSMKVTNQSSYGSISFNTQSQEKGKEYYYSAWFKLDEASVSPNGDPPAYPKANICLQYSVDGATKQIVIFSGAPLSASEWQQVQGTHAINETGNVTGVFMYIYTGGPAALDTYYIDDVEIRPVSYEEEGGSETVTLTVKPDGTGNFLSPKLANDFITDSGPTKQYVILIYPGVYTETNWVVKPYTTLRGTDRELCWLKGELPANATNSQITGLSTIWLKATASLENLTITAKNMKYAVHSEDNGYNKDAVHHVLNCYIEHYGNQEAVQYRQDWIAGHPGETPSPDLNPSQVWAYTYPWGYGSASGLTANFYDSEFISRLVGWHVHNREDFTKPQINTVNNSRIVSSVESRPILVQSLGSGTKDQVIFNNCELVGTYVTQNDSPWISEKPENQYANHADFTVTLNNSTPVGYSDRHRGRALAITSSSTGDSSYVRVSGDAADILLGQYITRDGGGSLKGYIYGYWDISGIKAGLNSDIDVANTLGRRLGDCSVNNKTLNVTFEDGTVKTIVFNENYTAQPNAYILDKINSVLGASGTASEYNVTENEYYPQVPDKQLTLQNNTTAGIPRFAAVCFDGDASAVRLMTPSDPVESFLGISLEPMPPGQSGRILTEGLMNKSQLHGFGGAIGVGTKISISSSQDGAFEISANQPALLEGVLADWAYFKGSATVVPAGVAAYASSAVKGANSISSDLLIQNFGAAPQNVTAIVAVYGATGKLAGIASATKATALAKGEEWLVTLTVSGLSFESGADYTAKAFIWDRYTLVPLCAALDIDLA
jgi:hypothetical protein